METNAAVECLAALAQETRLSIFRLLVAAGSEGLPAGEIACRLGVQAPTLSFHLAHLKQAGLVTRRRDSRMQIYGANYSAMNDLVAFLTENCCRGLAAPVALCAPDGAACAPAGNSARPARPRHAGHAGPQAARGGARS